jgi:hypothetical protein
MGALVAEVMTPTYWMDHFLSHCIQAKALCPCEVVLGHRDFDEDSFVGRKQQMPYQMIGHYRIALKTDSLLHFRANPLYMCSRLPFCLYKKQYSLYFIFERHGVAKNTGCEAVGVRGHNEVTGEDLSSKVNVC